MSIKSFISRVCFGPEPESIRLLAAHTDRLRADPIVQDRRRAAAVAVAQQNRKLFLPALGLVWAGAVAVAWQLSYWPEGQAVIMGSATCAVVLSYLTCCTASD